MQESINKIQYLIKLKLNIVYKINNKQITMSEPKPIQLGLCCINSILRAQKPPVFCSRKMIIRTVQEKGIDVLKDKILQNLADVIKMIEWNEQNGIRV